MCRSEIPATKTTVNFTESVLGHRVDPPSANAASYPAMARSYLPSRRALWAADLWSRRDRGGRASGCLIVSDCLTVSKEAAASSPATRNHLRPVRLPGGETMTSDSSRLRPAVVAGFEGHGGPAIERSSSCGGVSSADDCGEVFVGDGDRAIFGLPHHCRACQFVQGDVRFLLGSARHRTDQWRVSAAPEHRDCIEYLDGRPAERCDPCR